MKRLITAVAALAVIALGLCLPACNTTKGLGTDIEKAGEGMKNSAERTGAE